MAWRKEFQRIAPLLATVLLASALLTACSTDSPRTHLDWYSGSDVAPHHHRHIARVQPHSTPERVATRHIRPTFVSRDLPPPGRSRDLPPPVRTARADYPSPSPKPDVDVASYDPAPVATPLPRPDEPDTRPDPVVPDSGAPIAFGWPLSGPVISDFGSTDNGGHNDGINIAAPSGSPIHAAAAGTVSYSGNELKGYGNLVLIKHDDGYVTAYAHADRIVVNRGDHVEKGQIIGYAGQTGDVSSPQLHFEIRQGVKPVNPRRLLLASRAS